MKKIRILYFIPLFGTGGTERLVLDLCRLLDPQTFDAQVCVFKTGSFEEDLRKLGKKVHTIATGQQQGRGKGVYQKIQDLRSRLTQLKAHTGQLKPDILHTHHIGPMLHVLLTRRRLGVSKWIHTEHIRPDIDLTNNPPRLLALGKYAYRLPNQVTGVSEAVGEYFKTVARVPPKKVITILNGVDVKAFSSVVDVKTKRRELGFTSNDFLIGTIGNLREQKNHKNLLLAFSQLAQEAPNAQLVLAGDGTLRGELEVLAKELGIVSRVHFLGHRLDAHEIIKVLDIYCLPSFYEGMPLSILEAWSAGKSVVTTDVIGVKEIVKHEFNGILVPSDSSGRLAEALLRVMNDSVLRETLGKNGQQFVLNECGIDKMVKKYEQLYLQMLDR